MRRLFCRPLLLSILAMFALAVVLTQVAQAQTFKVLHTFTGGADGSTPNGDLAMDAQGNLYGTTAGGGYPGGECQYLGPGCGTVFQLAKTDSSWVLTPIYSFQGGSDGALPFASVIFGGDGSVYGTTYYGGSENCGPYGCGTVFQLRRPPGPCERALCSWTETVLYRFQPPDDGVSPYSPVTFDSAGNLYGTTYYGGSPTGYKDSGTVYQLTPSGEGWTESLLYSFLGGWFGDGGNPTSGVILDGAGNLYGTSVTGGNHMYPGGEIYQVARSGSGWNYRQIFIFQQSDSGTSPSGSLISDAGGNFYGATMNGSSPDSGPTVYEFSPSGGGWTFAVLYTWPAGAAGARDSLAMDRAGNLYGTESDWEFPPGYGSIFKLTHSDGSWVYTTLHRFSGSDGLYPNGGLVVDADGNLYGTTASGGRGDARCGYYGCGVVFEITP